MKPAACSVNKVLLEHCHTHSFRGSEWDAWNWDYRSIVGNYNMVHCPWLTEISHRSLVCFFWVTHPLLKSSLLWIRVYVWLSSFAVHLKSPQHCLLIGYTSIQDKKLKKKASCRGNSLVVQWFRTLCFHCRGKIPWRKVWQPTLGDCKACWGNKDPTDHVMQ